jgi:hypothetical protein
MPASGRRSASLLDRTARFSARVREVGRYPSTNKSDMRAWFSPLELVVDDASIRVGYLPCVEVIEAGRNIACDGICPRKKVKNEG